MLGRTLYYNSQLACLEVLVCVMIMNASLRDLAGWQPDSLSRHYLQSPNDLFASHGVNLDLGTPVDEA